MRVLEDDVVELKDKLSQRFSDDIMVQALRDVELRAQVRTIQDILSMLRGE